MHPQPFGSAEGFFCFHPWLRAEMNRRDFLSISAGAGALLLPSALRGEDSGRPARKTGNDEPQIRVLMAEADGSPLDKERAQTLCARDLANDPLPQRITRAEGRARIVLANEPIQISLRLKVPGFGEVYCWADNGGRGYSEPINIKFAVDAAATRLRRVREAYELAKREGATIDPQTEKYLKDAGQQVRDDQTAYAALA